MKTRLLAVLIANLFAATGALAADGGEPFEVSGSLGVGLRSNIDKVNDAAKLNEYRDIYNGVFGSFAVEGRGDRYYFDAYGENLGAADMYLDARGGKVGVFKYRLYDDYLEHNWAWQARSPLSGAGSASLTAPFAANPAVAPFSLNADTWNRFDLRDKRKDLGGMFEISNNSPWYVRVEANEVKEQGLKLIAGSNGTSPGNGFMDKPYPVDFLTRNFTVEGGYAAKAAQLSVSASHSKFTNQNDTFNWTNGFFRGQDTTTLPADSTQTRFGINGVLKQLPWSSTLSGRLTYSKTENNISILQNILSTGGTNPATNPDRTTFDGDVVHKTAALSLHSSPTRELDWRAYWYWFKKDNRSGDVTFTPAAPSGLQCGGGPCTTETLGYKKNNLGLEAGYRINPQNRVIAGFDYLDLERNRFDFDDTKDRKYTLEYRNTSLDELQVRAKYQFLDRRSHFLLDNAGVNANDPEFLNRFIARFDAANLDQNLIKIMLDAQPAKLVDLGFEGIFKENKYKNTVLGRTKDTRQEFYFSAAYGDMQEFRVMAFADIEFVQYDSKHRNISSVSNGTGVPSGAGATLNPNDTPNGFCPSTIGAGASLISTANCYDPGVADNRQNYNWSGKSKDTNWSIGLGMDWTPSERTKVKSSLVLSQTDGSANFGVPNIPGIVQVPIAVSDDTEKVSFNLKGTYAFTKELDLTAGFAFERYRFKDISYDGYQYTIGNNNQASYLSGAYAYPNYNVSIYYLMASYKFK